MTAQMLRSGAGLPSAADNFSAHNLLNLEGPGQNFEDGIAPMKLNFSNEALGDSSADLGAIGHERSASVENHMLLLDDSAAAALNEFPSLKDLETSNLLTNRFMGDKAAKFAL